MDELSEEDKITRRPGPADRAVPVAEHLRGQAVHRHRGLDRAAGGDHRGVRRRSPRASTTTSPSRRSSCAVASRTSSATARSCEMPEERARPAVADMRRGAGRRERTALGRARRNCVRRPHRPTATSACCRGHEPTLAQMEEAGVGAHPTPRTARVTVAVHGGFLSITADGRPVLAEIASCREEIDVPRGRAQRSRASSASSPGTPDGVGMLVEAAPRPVRVPAGSRPRRRQRLPGGRATTGAPSSPASRLLVLACCSCHLLWSSGECGSCAAAVWTCACAAAPALHRPRERLTLRHPGRPLRGRPGGSGWPATPPARGRVVPPRRPAVRPSRRWEPRPALRDRRAAPARPAREADRTDQGRRRDGCSHEPSGSTWRWRPAPTPRCGPGSKRPRRAQRQRRLVGLLVVSASGRTRRRQSPGPRPCCGARPPPGCHSTSPPARVRHPAEDEQQVREPVEVLRGQRVRRARRRRPSAAQVDRSARRATVRATCRYAARACRRAG